MDPKYELLKLMEEVAVSNWETKLGPIGMDFESLPFQLVDLEDFSPG